MVAKQYLSLLEEYKYGLLGKMIFFNDSQAMVFTCMRTRSSAMRDGGRMDINMVLYTVCVHVCTCVCVCVSMYTCTCDVISCMYMYSSTCDVCVWCTCRPW